MTAPQANPNRGVDGGTIRVALGTLVDEGHAYMEVSTADGMLAVRCATNSTWLLADSPEALARSAELASTRGVSDDKRIARPH